MRTNHNNSTRSLRDGRFFMDNKLIRFNVFRVCAVMVWGLFFIFGLYPDAAKAQKQTDQTEILVIGNGRIIQENIAEARKEAISDAMTKGIEKYLVRYLGSRGMVNYFQRIIQEVIPASGEAIENFHILAEERHEKDYKILAGIKVNEVLMEDTLRDTGIILLEGPPVKLLFLVSQKMPYDRDISCWWGDPASEALTSTEVVLHRVFQDRGFDPVNRLLRVPEDKVTPEMRKPYLSDSAVIEWGRLFSADYVISGENEIIENKMVSLILKVFDVEKGELLTRDSEIENVSGDPADPDRFLAVLEQSVRDTAARLIPIMIEDFQEGEGEVNTIEVELRGLRGFEQFRVFRDFLNRDISGVKSVTPARIKGSSMTLLVEFTGKEEILMDKIKRNMTLPYRAEMNQAEDGGIVIDIETSSDMKEEIHTE